MILDKLNSKLDVNSRIETIKSKLTNFGRTKAIVMTVAVLYVLITSWFFWSDIFVKTSDDLNLLKASISQKNSEIEKLHVKRDSLIYAVTVKDWMISDLNVNINILQSDIKALKQKSVIVKDKIEKLTPTEQGALLLSTYEHTDTTSIVANIHGDQAKHINQDHAELEVMREIVNRQDSMICVQAHRISVTDQKTNDLNSINDVLGLEISKLNDKMSMTENKAKIEIKRYKQQRNCMAAVSIAILVITLLK